jgi:hypothetical protein
LQRDTFYRRDLAWIGLLITVAIGAWLDDRDWHSKIARLKPDADSSWSISPAQP